MPVRIALLLVWRGGSASAPVASGCAVDPAAAAEQLLPHQGSLVDEGPGWCPDGRRLAFQSDRSGVMPIWVMDPGGGT